MVLALPEGRHCIPSQADDGAVGCDWAMRVRRRKSCAVRQTADWARSFQALLDREVEAGEQGHNFAL